ncbi:endonuclease exonuclease phosphatase family protein [Niveomyces insectorum RCEF 264]|uniref:Endonuclease exonuclease phosphatase family protein n=1 Tax=Niveomyces insectorum RCEF 264 TaxID=1081102 RepID=A0A167X3L3_9HYPO|nr:endonuclease exonuclease phosphatase family protein [Niveomyces insectorum RCEF 264]
MAANSSGRTSMALPLRLVTFNVRYATTTPAPGEQPWRVRRPKLGAQLRFVTAGHDAAFVCLQEALYQQVLDIQSELSQGGFRVDTDGHTCGSGPGPGTDPDAWAYIGRGRDDGKLAGEFSPIFYRPRVWRCVRSAVYWLSPTPETPSRGWDAVLNRIVTVGRFEHRATGASVVVMSTHFDHVGVQARQASAKLILDLAAAWQQQPGGDDVAPRSTATAVPVVFLGGDFNSEPDDQAYQTITNPHGGMVDVAGLVPPARRYGNDTNTYTSFGEAGETPKRIDFLFLRDTEGGLVFRTFGVLANRFDDGVFLSDHRAVVTDVDVPVAKDVP